jgi:hypothetical protein
MDRIAQHKLLVAGNSFDHCSNQVRLFFARTSLVRYDSVATVAAESSSALSADFFPVIERAEGRNRQIIAELLDELTRTGLRDAGDLLSIEQGYRSKTLHILSHFLDGFIGTDSYFYNLIDDSHWLPSTTAAQIRAHPGQFWLIHLDCFSATPTEAALLHL